MQYDDFTQMPVWQKSVELLKYIYLILKKFPSEERFCLTDDIRRAVNSIAHNIAEAFGRFEPKDKTRFYKFSRGSSFELMSQAIVAEQLKYINPDEMLFIKSALFEIIKELNLIIKTVECKK